MTEDKKPKNTGIIEIHGKSYKTVALRVSSMREDHPDWIIKTKVLKADESYVLIKASIYDSLKNLVATGHAEEARGTGINKTSALENCETSAIGRALAACGYLSTDYASEEEIQDASYEKQFLDLQEDWINRMIIIRRILPSVMALKEYMNAGQFVEAYEVWAELTDEEKMAVWNPAPTKGGILTTQERTWMKGAEWSNAREKVE